MTDLLFFLIYILAVFPVFGVAYLIIQKFFTTKSERKEDRSVNMALSAIVAFTWPLMVPFFIFVGLAYCSCQCIAFHMDKVIKELDKVSFKVKDEDEEDN